MPVGFGDGRAATGRSLTVRLRSQRRRASLELLVGRRSTATVGVDGSLCDHPQNLTSNSFHFPSDGGNSSVTERWQWCRAGRAPVVLLARGPCRRTIDSPRREPMSVWETERNFPGCECESRRPRPWPGPR